MYAERIWRELFRHPSLNDSLAGIAPVLDAELGLQAIAVLAIDLERRVLRVVAEHKADGWPLSLPTQRRGSGDEMNSFLAWVREGCTSNSM